MPRMSNDVYCAPASQTPYAVHGSTARSVRAALAPSADTVSPYTPMHPPAEVSSSTPAVTASRAVRL